MMEPPLVGPFMGLTSLMVGCSPSDAATPGNLAQASRSASKECRNAQAGLRRAQAQQVTRPILAGEPQQRLAAIHRSQETSTGTHIVTFPPVMTSSLFCFCFFLNVWHYFFH
jgi:hypothetical protein